MADINLYLDGALSGGANRVVKDSNDNSVLIISTSNVGIGTTVLTEGRLNIKQVTDSSSGGLTIRNSAAGGSTVRLWMDDSSLVRLDGGSTGSRAILLDAGGTGNVGIGISAGTPAEKLTIGTENTSPTNRKAIRLNSGGYAEPAAYNTASNGDKIILYDNTGSLYDGRIGIGSGQNLWLKSSGSTANSGEIEFYTGSTPTRRLHIDGNGDVGIGTTAGVSRLYIVQRTDSSDGGIIVKNSNLGGTARLWIDDSSKARIDAGSTGAMPIVLNGGGSGKVGIGETNPAHKLDIDGEMKVNSRIHGGSSDELYLQSAVGKAIIFETNGESEKVRITSDGIVGIGTTVCNGRLTIRQIDNANYGGIEILTSNGTSGSARFWMDNSNRIRIDGGADAQDDIILNGDGHGNVGIGVTALDSIDSVLHVKGNLSKIASGTVAVTNLSDQVIGTGTSFLTELVVGDSIKIESIVNSVKAITDNTHLTLKNVWPGFSHSGITLYYDPNLTSIYKGYGDIGLIINRTGNVGIGLSNPGAKLTILDSANESFYIVNSGGSTNYLYMGAVNGLGTTGYGRIGFFHGGDATFGNLVIGDGAATNVGIGVTNPTEKLQVNGNILLKNNLMFFDDNFKIVCDGNQIYIMANNAFGMAIANGAVSMNILSVIDHAVLNKIVMTNYGQEPSSPVEGEVYYDARVGYKTLRVYDGTNWKNL